MTEWTNDIARRLRDPLPPEQIGKLPKIPRDQQSQPKRGCNFCGGYHQPIPDRFHVEYISHTTTTDRLNSIVGQDGWSYTIDHIQEDGTGHVRGIVATLTIAGVSKQEAGSPGKTAADWGEELKLAISDWLPRAAMRFGLGLEVWAKQPLDRVILDDGHDARPQNRQETGQAQRRRSAQVPEGGEEGVAPPSGSNGQVRSMTEARTYVQAQPPEWRERFEQVLGDARINGEIGQRLSLEEIQRLIVRTHASMAGKAA